MIANNSFKNSSPIAGAVETAKLSTASAATAINKDFTYDGGQKPFSACIKSLHLQQGCIICVWSLS